MASRGRGKGGQARQHHRDLARLQNLDNCERFFLARQGCQIFQRFFRCFCQAKHFHPEKVGLLIKPDHVLSGWLANISSTSFFWSMWASFIWDNVCDKSIWVGLREIVGHVVGGGFPPGYNLWASSCRQVIRAPAIWEHRLIYCPAFSDSKAKPGFKGVRFQKYGNDLPPLLGFGYTLVVLRPSWLALTSNLRSSSSEAPILSDQVWKLICFLGKGSLERTKWCY